jgi:hypothetical protein
VYVISPLYSSQLKSFLHVSVLAAGPKLKDLRAAVDTDPEVQAEIGKLKAELIRLTSHLHQPPHFTVHFDNL